MVFLADQDAIRAAKSIRKVDMAFEIAIGLEKDAILNIIRRFSLWWLQNTIRY